jgi:hypothetical protein
MCLPSSPKMPPPPPVPAAPATEINANSTALREKAPTAPQTASGTPLSVAKRKGKSALRIELDQSNLQGGQSGINIPL